MISHHDAKQMVKGSDADVFLNTSADVAGELLRGLTFPANNTDETDWGLGCYSTFEVIEDARPLDKDARAEILAAAFGPEDDPDDWGYRQEEIDTSTGYTFEVAGATINVVWYWDGDGTLIYQILTDAGERVIHNSDCKKTIRWCNSADALYERELWAKVTR